jgi:hypothetical protein
MGTGGMFIDTGVCFVINLHFRSCFALANGSGSAYGNGSGHIR